MHSDELLGWDRRRWARDSRGNTATHRHLVAVHSRRGVDGAIPWFRGRLGNGTVSFF